MWIVIVMLSVVEWEHLTDHQKDLHSTMRDSWLSSYSKASHTVLQHWLWRFLKKQTQAFAPLHKVFAKIKVDSPDSGTSAWTEIFLLYPVRGSSIAHKLLARGLKTCVGREDEGVSSLRPELVALARTLQATSAGTDLLYLCDSGTTLTEVSRWIGRGPRMTLAGNANADITKTIIECLRARVIRGTHIHGQEYEWTDKGVKLVSTWSKAVQTAMLQGRAEFQRQRVLTKAAGIWSKKFLRTTDTGWGRVQQAEGAGVTSDLMDSKPWEWECMIQLQEAENRQSPGATTWAAVVCIRRRS
jgi:hypothetical protein